jgi:hypothetical protein
MRIRCLLLVAAAALALPVAADAKGASEATVTGPGLDKPLFFGGGESEGTPVMNLTINAGFFPAAFCCQSPNPIRKSAPKGDLGAKYTIHYVVPNGAGTTDEVEQDLYPYARPNPVTYMKPGQRILDRETSGGWFVGTSELKRMLVQAGLPAQAQGVERRASSSRGRVMIAAAFGVALAAAAGYVLMRRRKD